MNKLELNREIYSIHNIERVAKAYENYAEIKIYSGDETVQVVFKNCKYDFKVTMKEFENYLINLENTKS